MEECLKNQNQVPPKFMKPKESGPGTPLDIAKQLPKESEHPGWSYRQTSPPLT